MHTPLLFSLPLSHSTPYLDFFVFLVLHCLHWMLSNRRREQQPRHASTIDINLFEHFMHSTIQHMNYFEWGKRKTFRRFRFFQVMFSFSYLYFLLCVSRFSIFSISFLHRKMKKFRFFESNYFAFPSVPGCCYSVLVCVWVRVEILTWIVRAKLKPKRVHELKSVRSESRR